MASCIKRWKRQSVSLQFINYAFALLLMVFTATPVVSIADDDTPELPETCYLFAHFYLNGQSGLHLAWSPDGLDWEMLNDGESYLVPTVGESGLMRDPSLERGPDGTFHMVWTTAWSGQTIGYASSKDLINWSEQKSIPVMGHEPDAQNCWAPEVHYIPEKDHYLILWSTTIPDRFPETALTNRRPSRNHRIYSTTTKDFESFTPTRLYYDAGFNVIDAALLKDGDEWLMVVKHEELSPHTEKNIRLIRAKTSMGPFSEPSEPISGEFWAEGAYPMKVGDEYFVYFDNHMVDEYGVTRSKDLKTWEDISKQGDFPENANHGSFVEVPREVVNKLLNP